MISMGEVDTEIDHKAPRRRTRGCAFVDRIHANRGRSSIEMLNGRNKGTRDRIFKCDVYDFLAENVCFGQGPEDCIGVARYLKSGTV